MARTFNAAGYVYVMGRGRVQGRQKEGREHAFKVCARVQMLHHMCSTPPQPATQHPHAGAPLIQHLHAHIHTTRTHPAHSPTPCLPAPTVALCDLDALQGGAGPRQGAHVLGPQVEPRVARQRERAQAAADQQALRQLLQRVGGQVEVLDGCNARQRTAGEGVALGWFGGWVGACVRALRDMRMAVRSCARGAMCARLYMC